MLCLSALFTALGPADKTHVVYQKVLAVLCHFPRPLWGDLSLSLVRRYAGFILRQCVRFCVYLCVCVCLRLEQYRRHTKSVSSKKSFESAFFGVGVRRHYSVLFEYGWWLSCCWAVMVGIVIQFGQFPSNISLLLCLTPWSDIKVDI